MPRPCLSSLFLFLMLAALASSAYAQDPLPPSTVPANVDWDPPVTPSTSLAVAPDLNIPVPGGSGNYHTVAAYEAAFNQIVTGGTLTEFEASQFVGWKIIQIVPSGRSSALEVIGQFPSPGTEITPGEHMHLLVADVGGSSPTTYFTAFMVTALVLVFVVALSAAYISQLRRSLVTKRSTDDDDDK